MDVAHKDAVESEVVAVPLDVDVEFAVDVVVAADGDFPHGQGTDHQSHSQGLIASKAQSLLCESYRNALQDSACCPWQCRRNWGTARGPD